MTQTLLEIQTHKSYIYTHILYAYICNVHIYIAYVDQEFMSGDKQKFGHPLISFDVLWDFCYFLDFAYQAEIIIFIRIFCYRECTVCKLSLYIFG